ncbi:peptidylprolyl isomerase [bacterium]|nr:peptidylprolyl isomerase [bacterium]
MVAQKGNKIKVHYKGMLTDGTVFDSSFNREPLEFVLGEGVLIPGFEKAVEGMELNEEKLVEIPSNEAYGEIDTNLIVELSLASLPEDFTAEVGEVIQLQDQSGGIVPGAIIEVGEENIKVDLNSPLAGQDLTFKIKVVGIE